VDFQDNPDHAAIRQAVVSITLPFGGSYYAERAERHEPTDELWRALGKLGYIGINLPERFGGGGAGFRQVFHGLNPERNHRCGHLCPLVQSSVASG